jgi:hypothetical protein
MNNPIWSSLWRRAAEEPIGIAFKVDKVWNGFVEAIRKARPADLPGFTLSITPDPNTFYITHPDAVIDDSIPD